MSENRRGLLFALCFGLYVLAAGELVNRYQLSTWLRIALVGLGGGLLYTILWFATGRGLKK